MRNKIKTVSETQKNNCRLSGRDVMPLWQEGGGVWINSPQCVSVFHTFPAHGPPDCCIPAIWTRK